ncbi:MAG: heavy metal sensor histidine kinase [Sulfuritalea sp.]|nr:heavy metal sensor histidine kinase [Sulfuritalea sp.]
MRLSEHKSITFRLTLLFSSASTLVLLLLGFLIGGSVEQHFVEQDMAVLTGKLALARHTLEKVHSRHDLDSVLQQLDDSLVGHHGLALVIVGPGGETLFATSGADFPQALLDRHVQAGVPQPTVWKTKQGTPFRGIAAMARTSIEGAAPVVVALATDISHHEQYMDSFRLTLWTVVILAALLTGFLGWIAVRRGLAPLQAIKREAAGITAHRLDARLATDSIPAELAELAETLNAMLARLEDSFQRLSDFSSDLAHELRTPISNLMTETQVALTRTRSVSEYREVLASNVEEYERLARMVGDMLFLAQAENGLIVPNREPVDLAAQVRELFDFFDALAEEKALHLSLTGAGSVSGDKLMLRRALANLISNAIRHTPVGGSIRIRIETTDEGTILAVENTGDPIPQEQLSRIFDRFYRADPARHGGGEGAGLGLAITRTILRAHGGEISVRSGIDGVCFEMRMG